MPCAEVSFETEKQSATLCGDFANLTIAGASFGVDVKKTSDSPLNRGVDVWLVRAPKKDPGIELALKFYIQGFFAMDKADFLNSQNYRNLAVSAGATGITHNADGLTGDAWKDQVIEAPKGDVASLGLRKVGFQSHAG